MSETIIGVSYRLDKFAYMDVGKGRKHAYRDIGGRTTQETKSSNCRGCGSFVVTQQTATVLNDKK